MASIGNGCANCLRQCKYIVSGCQRFISRKRGSRSFSRRCNNCCNVARRSVNACGITCDIVNVGGIGGYCVDICRVACHSGDMYFEYGYKPDFIKFLNAAARNNINTAEELRDFLDGFSPKMHPKPPAFFDVIHM